MDKTWKSDKYAYSNKMHRNTPKLNETYYLTYLSRIFKTFKITAQNLIIWGNINEKWKNYVTRRVFRHRIR